MYYISCCSSIPNKAFTSTCFRLLTIWLSISRSAEASTEVLSNGLLHYKPRNTNLQQYPIVVSSTSCASGERKDMRWLKRRRSSGWNATQGADKESVLKRIWPGYIPRSQPRSDWSARVRTRGIYWLGTTHSHARTNGLSRTFRGCWCLCALISGLH